jgi:recombination protein RecA
MVGGARNTPLVRPHHFHFKETQIMVRRVQASIVEPKKPDNYFKKSNLEFISTGCVTFDCVLGGGWPLGRISNLVGDKSTGKTLCAIEAAANFTRKFPDGHIWYREAEAAFDKEYAEGLGLPVDKVDFGKEGLGTPWETIEEIYDDLKAAIGQGKDSGQPGLYVIDSLDALSSTAELGREMNEGSYGMEKQKQLGQMFRRLTQGMSRSRIHFLIISQVRENIGAMFGNKYRRSGGKALDFYASQVVYLSHLKTLNKTVGGIKRAVGVQTKVKCTKNKIGLPFRECEFSIRFGYGIDELAAAIEWLESAGKAKEILQGSKASAFVADSDKLDDVDYRALLRDVRKTVRREWRAVDEKFAPTRRKY